MDFGCFVELQGFRSKQEGLVHLSNISRDKRGGSAKDMVGKGARPAREGAHGAEGCMGAAGPAAVLPLRGMLLCSSALLGCLLLRSCCAAQQLSCALRPYARRLPP